MSCQVNRLMGIYILSIGGEFTDLKPGQVRGRVGSGRVGSRGRIYLLSIGSEFTDLKPGQVRGRVGSGQGVGYTYSPLGASSQISNQVSRSYLAWTGLELQHTTTAHIKHTQPRHTLNTHNHGTH
jgi:hypothetical protein